jgi:hypothetical protein
VIRPPVRRPGHLLPPLLFLIQLLVVSLEARFYFPPLEMDPDFNRMVLATNAVWQLGVRGSTAVSQIGDSETVTWRYWDWNDANNNNAIDPGEVVGQLTSLNTTRTFLSTTFAPTTIDYFVRRQGGVAGPFLTPGSGNADQLQSISASTLALFTSATGSPKRVWVGTADFIQRALGAGGDFDPTDTNPASIPSTQPPPYPSGLGRTAIRWVDSAVSGSNTSDIDAFYIVAANYRGSYPSPYGTAVLQSQVYMTTDGGSSWNSIGDLLPDVPVRAIAVEPRGPGWQDDVVYVGTDGGVLNGVYATLFRGTFDASLNQWVWTPMQPTSPSGTRLPLVPITDLQINQQFSTLLVATYGRGIWGLYINVNLPPEIKVPGPQVMNEDSTLTFSPAQFTEISILDRDAGTAPVELHLEVQHGRLSLASTAGLTLVAGNNNSPSMTYRGSQAAINAALNGLVYTPDANYFGVDTLVVRVSDLKNSGVVPPAVPPDYATKGWTTEERVEIRITPINDAPQITAPTATQTVPMNRWLAFTSANGNSITVSDVDAGVNPMTLTVGVSQGTLTLGSTAGLLTVTGNGTGSVSVTGSLLALNNALSGLVYTPNAGYSGSDTLTITVSDNGHIGSSGPLTDTKTVSIQVSSANNDAPYLSVPGPQDVLANSSLVLSSGNSNALQIQNEPDAGSGGPWAGAHPVRFTVSVSQGKLQLLNPGTLYLVQGPNDGTASLLTFEGPVSDVNNALANGLRYVPNSGFVGNDLLVFTVNDLGATGSGGPQSDSDTVLLRVMNANQAPVNTVPGPQTVAEDTDLVFAGTLSVADADAGSNPIQVTLSVSHGFLILATTSGLTSVVGNNTSTITMQGPQAAINAALNGLRYRPNANYNGSDTLTITTDDLGNSGFGGPQTDTDTVSITVTAVNDAPTVTLPITQFTAMNTNLTLPAIGVGDVDDADDGTSGNIVLQVTLSVTNGDLTLPTTAGLTFSVGGGTSATMTFSGQLSDILAALNGVVYNPASGFTGVATLSVSVNDLGNSGAGGAQGASGSLLIAVGMPGNQAPVNAVPPAPQTTLEDVPLEFSTINNNAITFDTPFAGDNPFEVQLSVTNGILVLARTAGIRFTAGSNASASMTIEGRLADIHAALDGLKYVPTLDYSGPAQLTVTGRFVGEPPAAADTVSIPIQVFPANDPPRVSVPLAQSVAPNAQLYFNAANNNALSVTDPDNTSGNVQFTISVTSGTLVLLDTTGLSISGNGTSTITGSGPINVLNLRLAGSGPTTGLRFTAPGSNTVVTLTFTVNDLGNTGTGGAQSHSARVLIRVGSGSLANNQAPTITVQGGLTKTVPEDQFFIFSSTANQGITITDADAGSNIVQVQLSVGNGFLVLPTIAGLEFTGGGNGKSSMTIRGSIASINAALSGMVYYPNPNFVGSDTLAITVDDLGNMGGPLPPPNQTDSRNITLNVTPVNDAPLIYVPRMQQTPVNTSLLFSTGNSNALQVFDPDLNPSDTVEFALRVDFGKLNIPTSGSLVVANNNTDFVTGTGTFGDLQAALSSGVQFDPPTGFQGLVNLTFSVNDLSLLGPKTGVGNALVGVGVTPPTTPVLVRSPGSVIVDEDGTLVFSTANNNRISISDADAGTNPVEVTLSVSAGTLTLGSTTGLTFTAGSNGSSSMTFRGTIAAINNALEGLTFAPPPNFNGQVTLTVVTNDLGNLGSGGPQTDTDTVIIKVRPINDGPAVVLAASSQAIVQDTALVFSSSNGNAITFSDLELSANSTIDVRLEVDQGILHLPDVTGLVFLDGGNNSPSFTIRSTKSIIESKLNGLVYIPPSGFTGTATLKVSISDLGQTGFGGALSDTQNITIAVQPVNARPAVNVPGPQSVYRNQTLTLSGANAISITDADGNVPVEVVLAVSSGRLFLPNTSGLTLVMGNNSSRLTIRGLRNTVNLRLNGLQFIPAYDYDGLVLLTATVNDLGNSNGGGPLTASNSVLINVQPVNSQPTALPNVTSFSLTEDQSGPFTINLSYITPGGGVFEAGQSLTLTVTEVPVNLNGFSTLFSTLTINNTSFAGGGPWPQSTFVSFSLAANAFGDAIIRITIQDDGGTANGGQNTLVIDIPVSVARANDAPLLATGTYALGSIPEDPSSNPGISVQAFVNTLISGGHYSDADDGHPSGYTDPRGIAITAVDNSNGTWQYSTDGGSIWTNIPSIGAGQGFVLAADAAGQYKIRFVPNADWNGTTTITFRAWDRSNGASNASLVSIPLNGTPPSDTSAYSANSATAQLTVTPVNDPPFANSTSTNWTNTLQEDNFPPVPGTFYPEITLTDLKPGPNTATDETSQTMSVSANLQVISGPMSGTFQYSVNGGTFTATDPTGLSINDDVVVQFQPAANASGNANIVITIQDSGGAQATLSFSLQITPQNDAPVLGVGPWNLGTIVEDPPSNPGISIRQFIANNSGMISDADDAPPGYFDPRGIAITAFDNSNGTWQYSTDGGSTWTNIPSIGAGQGFVLAADDSNNNRIRFVPNADWNGTTTITFRAWDRSDGTTNGTKITSFPPNGTPPNDTSAYSSASATAQLTVTPVNDPPVVDLNGSAPGIDFATSFDPPGPQTIAIVDSTGLTVTDVDSLNLSGATITLTNPQDGTSERLIIGGLLSNGTVGGITVTYGVNFHSITLSGSDSLANYESLLRTLQYRNTKTFPNLTSRVITVVVQDDGSASSATATATVNFDDGQSPSIDLNGSASGTGYDVVFQTPGPVDVYIVDTSNATITDPDSVRLDYLKAVLTSRPDGSSEQLVVDTTVSPSLVATYDASTGELLITAATPQPIGDFQQVLRTLRYQNSKLFPTPNMRTIVVTVSDGYSTASATATVSFLGPSAPTLDLDNADTTASGSDYIAQFPSPGSGTSVAIVNPSGLVITDPDSTHLTQAQALLINRPDGANESLTVNSSLVPAGVTVSYNPASGLLDIVGLATVAQYQALLRSLSYQNTKPFPTLTSRTIQVVVNDGYGTSNVATATVNFVGAAPPSVDLNGPANPGTDYTVNFSTPGPGSVIVTHATATIDDPDSTHLRWLEAVLTARPDGNSNERLLVASLPASLSQVYNPATGVLHIEGTGPVPKADFITALQNLQYQNDLVFPSLTPRSIQVYVNDGYTTSATATATVNILGGLSPSVDLNGPASGTDFTTTLPVGITQVGIVDPSMTVTDPDSLILAGATIRITNLLDGGAESLDVNVGSSGISKSYNATTGTLTLSGLATVADYQTVLLTLVYQNTAMFPTRTTRQITVVVTDGYTNSNVATAFVNFAPNTLATVDLNGSAGGTNTTVQYQTPGPNQVVLAPQAQIIEDSNHLLYVELVLSNHPDGSNEGLNIAGALPGGLSWVYNAATFTGRIQGPGTKADFETALRQVVYFNNAVLPNLTTRAIQVVAHDGYGVGGSSTAAVVFLGGATPSVDLNGAGAGNDYVVTVATPGPVDVAVVDAGATINDADSTHLTLLRAVLTSRPDGSANEQLVVDTTGTGLVANYNATTGVLTVTAGTPRPRSEFQQVLRTLRYQNSRQYPTLPGRTIEVTVSDGYTTSAIATATVNILGGQSPSVDLNGLASGTGFSVNVSTPGPVDVGVVASSASISDPDSSLLVSLQAVLTSRLDGNSNEQLVVDTSGTGLVANYNATTGVLTVSAASPRPLSEFEQVLRTLRYQNSVFYPALPGRTIQVTVNDGYTTSAIATATVNFLGAGQPVVDLNGPSAGTGFSVTWQTPGPVDVAIVSSSAASITDPDSTHLVRLRVVLTNVLDGSNERLVANTTGTSLSANYNASTGVLIINGAGNTPRPVSEFELVLRTLRYQNDMTWPNKTPRTIQVTAFDGYTNSPVATASVQFWERQRRRWWI